MIAPMVRMSVAGHDSMTADCLRLLSQSGLFHPIDPKKERLFAKGESRVGVLTQEDEKKISALSDEIREIEKGLELLTGGGTKSPVSTRGHYRSLDWPDEKTIAKVIKIAARISSLHKNLKSKEHELARIAGFRKIYDRFAPLIETAGTLEGIELYGILPEGEPFQTVHMLAVLEQGLKNICGTAYSMIRADDENSAILVLFPVAKKNELIEKVIEPATRGLTQLRPPESIENESMAKSILLAISEEGMLADKIVVIEKEISSIGNTEERLLAEVLQALRRKRDQLAASAYLAFTRSTFWIAGYVPADKADSLRWKIESALDKKVNINTGKPEIGEYENIPVLLKNHPLIKPFERLLAIFPPPKYGTGDPTPYLALFFPIFFGMMLGDLGYATIITFGLFVIGKKTTGNRVVEDFVHIGFACAFSTAFFGIIYGEFFGRFWSVIGLPHPFFERAEQTEIFLGLAAVVGGLHLLLGTVLAIRLAVLQKSGRAFAIGLSDFVLISSFYLFAFSFLGGGENYRLVVAMMLGALIIKIIAGGWIELIESSRLISGVLSYARLMAVGMGSIIFADMADDLFFGSDNIIVALFMLVIIHGFNLMLGIFDPALQALRLHYVEFFGRFYKFGEVRFAPLGSQ